MSKVFLGVGHGGIDSGAVYNGIKEKDLNLDIAQSCRAELERHGVNVLMSRTKDENDPLTEEIRECNAYNPDLAIDIHNNAGGGDGVEVFHYHGGGTSKVLAQNILDSVVAIGQNSRGLKVRLGSNGKDYFGFIRETKPPAVLVECAFIDSSDVAIIDTYNERVTMGIAVAHGILKTLGVSAKPIEVVKPSVPAPSISNSRSAGAGVSLSNVPLYATSSSTSSIRCISGTYYIYDGQVIGNKMRITNSKDRVGKSPIGANVTGWVSTSSLG